MILNITNLANFTPSALTLTLKGAGTVTKALADVTISGDILTYTPSAAEKTTLGAGLLTCQVKLTASGDKYKSQIVQLDANDLDNEILTLLTLSDDMAENISAQIAALMPTAVTTQSAGTNVTINRFTAYSFMGLTWASFSITTSATIASSAAVISGLPGAAATTDFIMSTGIIGTVRSNGTIHFGASTAAGTYSANFVYK